MTKSTLVAASLAAFSLVVTPACSSSGDDGGTMPISEAPDAGASAPDAAPAAEEGLGKACVPGQQDSCPTGFVCVSFSDPGASGPFCTQQCTPAQNSDPCLAQTRYTGPGLPACIIGADTDGDMQVDVNLCGIVCEAPPQVCPGCDSTCPGAMQCSAALSDGNGNSAKACF